MQKTQAYQLMLCGALLVLSLVLLWYSTKDAKIGDVWPLVVIAVTVFVANAMDIVLDVFASLLGRLSLVVTQLDVAPAFGDSADPESALAAARSIANFQLALVSAVGFWLTLALLLAWSVRLRTAEDQNAASVGATPQVH